MTLDSMAVPAAVGAGARGRAGCTGGGPAAPSSPMPKYRRAGRRPVRIRCRNRNRRILALIIDQFRDVLIYLLLAAIGISLLVGDAGRTGDPCDRCAQRDDRGVPGLPGRPLAALQRMASPAAVVVRDGDARRVAAADLVPGDIVLLEAGAGVPADLRILEAAGLQAAEAALTGESEPGRQVRRAGGGRHRSGRPGEHALPWHRRRGGHLPGGDRGDRGRHPARGDLPAWSPEPAGPRPRCSGGWLGWGK